MKNIFLALLTILTIGAIFIPASAQTEQLHKSTFADRQTSEVSVLQSGVKGDGATDDTNNFQAALTKCSTYGLVCVVPKGKKVRITRPVFLWGNSSLVGETDAEILPDIADLTTRYVINLGLRGKQKPAMPFTGVIENITFRPLSGPEDKWLADKTPIAGRIIQFWRAEGAIIRFNKFELGRYFYGATAGQNVHAWMASAAQGIRRDITITNNIVNQVAGSHGQEGIGMNYATGLIISDNNVYGSGDDLIGLHWCDNVKILRNRLYGVDSRIYVSNGRNLLIDSNEVSRIASPLDGKFKKGVALVYVGYEYPAASYSPRPSDITITNNLLSLPKGAIDIDGVISVRGADNTIIESNIVKNNSKHVKAHGIWISPWTPPEMGDSAKAQAQFPVGNTIIRFNLMTGKYPLVLAITGQCVGYLANVLVSQNTVLRTIIGCKSKLTKK